MNKRLDKRHKRQVARARVNVKLSEPDVRTPEQVRAAREASRPTAGRTSQPLYAGPAAHNRAVPDGEAAEKDHV